MTYTNIIISIALIILLLLLFILEFLKIVEVIKNKARTPLDSYAVLNSVLLLLIVSSIHEYLFTDELFENCWYLLLAIIACYGFYQFLNIWDAKRARDSEKGSK